MEVSQLHQAYRVGAQNEIKSLIGKMMTCTCETCKNVTPPLRAELIAHGLVDALAAHIFAAVGANADYTGDSMIIAMNEAKQKLVRYFTEYGDENNSVREA
jgi:NAD-dependent SIR2 family protein deacetylase